MNKPDEKYVYHGSWESFDVVAPKRQKRGKVLKDGIVKIYYDDISFHATPYKWIALAYTDDQTQCEIISGRRVNYNKGVDLYKYREEIEVLGFGSLENSLEKIYGKGGYLYFFEKEKFFHTKGLGNLEVVTKDNIRPIKVERINDPVTELHKLGISFKFIDLAKQENEKYRNYLK